MPAFLWAGQSGGLRERFRPIRGFSLRWTNQRVELVKPSRHVNFSSLSAKSLPKKVTSLSLYVEAEVHSSKWLTTLRQPRKFYFIISQQSDHWLFCLDNHNSPSLCYKAAINFTIFSPTIEEVAAPAADNGEAEPLTEEVKTSENGANGSHEETKEPEVESTNGATEEKEETPKETTEEATEESAEEATKRKADAPSEDETVEKIAKLKETAAEVVAEAEQSLPKEPLTEAEATA